MALHTKGMCGIVDDFQSIGVGNLLDAVHIAGMAVAMHRHDGGGMRGNGGFDLVLGQGSGYSGQYPQTPA